jgi:xylan 1,4-beta-xylosidase
LYRSSYLAVKSVCPSIPVGGPSSFSAYGKKNDWIYKFLRWTKENECYPDFLDTHYYDADMSDVQLSKEGRRAATRLSPAPSTYSQFINNLKKELASCGFEKLPIMISEWNSTTTHRDPLSDTCFKSCYIVKNQVETLDAVDGAGYWLLTDFHSEILLNDKIFHGGLGMYTTNGIRKPAFFAYEFLSLLKDRILSRGDGYVVTKDQQGEVAILLYNYFHYSLAYAQEVGINTSYTDRYSVFPDKNTKKFDLDLILPHKRYAVQQAYLNRNRGSAFDEFVRMGAVEPLSKEESEFLAAYVLPGAEKSVMTTDHGKLQFSVTLEPLEIRLIRLFPMV